MYITSSHLKKHDWKKWVTLCTELTGLCATSAPPTAVDFVKGATKTLHEIGGTIAALKQTSEGQRRTIEGIETSIRNWTKDE